MVYGLGEKKTPEAFIAACDKFIFFEVLQEVPKGESEGGGDKLPALKPLLIQAIQSSARETGWASLSVVGGYIGKNNASFDSRNYGFPKLGELVRAQPYIQVRETGEPGGIAHLHVRVR